MTKTQELKNFSYFGISHKGNIREKNEDEYSYFETVNGTFFIVCDGMGGIKGGKEAAETAVREIEKFASEEWFEDPVSLITESITRANNSVFYKFPEKQLKPGTTIVLVMIRHNQIYYAHAGDSRLYYFTGKKLFQLTKDHSYVMELVDKKIITEEEARGHSRRNEITKAVGTHSFIDPTICKNPIVPADNDYILLCSDGLVNELSNKEISDILNKKEETQTKSEKLLNKALESGGNDNITVQLIKFYNTGREKNIDFLKQNINKRNNFFLPAAIVLLIIIIAFFVFIFKNELFKDKEYANEESSNKTNLLISINQNKDTLVQVLFKSGRNINEEIKKYNISEIETGHAISQKKKDAFVKYYIPVKAKYTNRAGKLLLTYPEITKDNIIDIIIVNNKTEIFLKPGETFLIPKEKQ